MNLSTRARIACARLAYQAVSIGRGPRRGAVVTVRRHGVRWRLDLREGIDFSIYLLGSFEPSVVRSYKRLVRPGSVVLDVGANVGAHTMPLAQAVGENGRVIAFEPTSWAFEKLVGNLALNPALSERVRAERVMLVAGPDSGMPEHVYSSWPLVGSDEVHPLHRGSLKSTAEAEATTLDRYVAAAGLDRVDFLKLDVDGAEPDVLAGAAETIVRYGPPIIMELAPYLYDGTDGFECLIGFLDANGYRIEHLRSRRELPPDHEQLRHRIPQGTSMNVLCMAR